MHQYTSIEIDINLPNFYGHRSPSSHHPMPVLLHHSAASVVAPGRAPRPPGCGSTAAAPGQRSWRRSRTWDLGDINDGDDGDDGDDLWGIGEMIVVNL